VNMAAPEGTTQDAVPDTTQLQTQSGNVIYLDKGDASRQSMNATPAQVQTHPHPVSPPIRDIALHILQHADNGISRFQLRLDPPELGRVEVRMEISADGKMSAVIAVERPETLDLLQRDSRALERSLMEAGLKTDGNSLSFSLKGGRHESLPHERASPGSPSSLTPTDAWDEPSMPMNVRFANRTVNIRI
jgi:flagellar hook-length control protein FliK